MQASPPHHPHLLLQAALVVVADGLLLLLQQAAPLLGLPLAGPGLLQLARRLLALPLELRQQLLLHKKQDKKTAQWTGKKNKTRKP